MLSGSARRLALGERGEVGRLADAPRVEELVLALDRKGEDLAPLEEEGPLLLVERLVGGEVDDRGVGLDLAEVRVHRGVESEVRGQADLRIEADRARAVGPPVGDRRARAGLAHRVGQQLDVAGAGQPADPVQLAELVHTARVLAGDELPLVLLLVAVDPAPGVEAPDLLLLRPVAQLAQGHAELGGPTLVVVRDLAVPDRRPRSCPTRSRRCRG